MPKEVIRYANEFVIRDGDVVYNPLEARESEQIRHTEELALHWTKGEGGLVQVSIQLDAEMVREQLRLVDENYVWVGEEVKPGMLMFYSGPIKRYEMQRLIRHARRARNDVYGADE